MNILSKLRPVFFIYQKQRNLTNTMSKNFLKYYIIIGLTVIITGAVIFYYSLPGFSKFTVYHDPAVWEAPDMSSIAAGSEEELVKYGRDLIINTAKYFGPKGSVASITNGMNCENCHLDAGTRSNGNCLAMVATSYPKFRERSGRLESVEFRINECMQRSLNGDPIDSLSREMRAMRAYILWLGTTVPKGIRMKGMGIPDMPVLSRIASIGNGEHVFASKCRSCHGAEGQGLFKPDSAAYFYPPLWGPHSYNVSAGINRLSRLAGYIKYNMPFITYPSDPQLTDEEAWDLAAYINSQQRPKKFFPYDWPKIASKPFDFPFGPYADSFPELQHRYGPFEPIKKHSVKTSH